MHCIDVYVVWVFGAICMKRGVVMDAWPYTGKDVEVGPKEGVASHHVRKDEDNHLQWVGCHDTHHQLNSRKVHSTSTF